MGQRIQDGTPNSTLQLISDGRAIFGSSIRVPNAAAYQALNAAGSANVVMASLDASNNYLYADSKLVVLSGGNVGVGTTAPAQPLEVGGVGGIRLRPSGTRPTCDSTIVGTLYYQTGGPGGTDDLQVCWKNNLDAYSWKSVSLL